MCAPQDSGIKAVDPAIRASLKENPGMPATVVAEQVCPHLSRVLAAKIVQVKHYDPVSEGSGGTSHLVPGNIVPAGPFLRFSRGLQRSSAGGCPS
jgi:hypothetical protein